MNSDFLFMKNPLVLIGWFLLHLFNQTEQIGGLGVMFLFDSKMNSKNNRSSSEKRFRILRRAKRLHGMLWR